MCMCVSRAISGVGFFALFFFVYYFFKLFAMLYLRCMSPVFGWVSFLCVYMMFCCRWFGGGGGRDGD